MGKPDLSGSSQACRSRDWGRNVPQSQVSMRTLMLFVAMNSYRNGTLNLQQFVHWHLHRTNRMFDSEHDIVGISTN